MKISIFFFFLHELKGNFFHSISHEIRPAVSELDSAQSQLVIEFSEKTFEKTQKTFYAWKWGKNGLLRYWHFFLNFICIWFKLFHKLFLLLNMIISVSIALLVSRKYFISLHGLKITKLYTYRWNKNSYVKSNYRHGVFPWCFLLAAI